jgi:hypothetical protein
VTRARISVLLLCALASGCQSVGRAPFALVPAGAVTVGGVIVTADEGWNARNGMQANFDGPGAVWTRDGMRLDYLIIVPDIADGASVFKEPNKQVVFPKFHASMLPNEIVTLVEASLTRKVFGEGQAVVSTSNLRPATYGSDRGFAFDVSVSASDGPDRKGTVGGFIAGGRLNLVMFIAAVPYYFDKDREHAQGVIASARRAAAT